MSDMNAFRPLQNAASASICLASIVVAASAVLLTRRALVLLDGAENTRRRLDRGLSDLEPGLEEVNRIASGMAETMRSIDRTMADVRRNMDTIRQSPVGNIMRRFERREDVE